MARRDLVVNLAAALPPEQATAPEDWLALHSNPAFSNCLLAIHKAHRAALDRCPSKDADADIRELWRSQGLKDALQAIASTEARAVGKAKE